MIPQSSANCWGPSVFEYKGNVLPKSLQTASDTASHPRGLNFQQNCCDKLKSLTSSPTSIPGVTFNQKQSHRSFLSGVRSFHAITTAQLTDRRTDGWTDTRYSLTGFTVMKGHCLYSVQQRFNTCGSWNVGGPRG
jgi:hypothetical protein